MGEIRFDAEQARDRLIAAIREHAEKEGFRKVVLGISGGKDSTVTAALCARALGKENVFGVMMPDGVQKDLNDSKRVCEALGIQKRVVNIGAVHSALRDVTDQKVLSAAEGEFAIPFSAQSETNVAPRLRMTVLRYIAQALGARLAGTGNLSESTVGYCTKDGDTSCDFSVLGALTSVEVVAVGRTMPELPPDLVEKTPADGLTDRSDEENLGLRYADIHRYIRQGTCGDAETDEKIRRKEAANMHKRRMPRILDPFGKEGEAPCSRPWHFSERSIRPPRRTWNWLGSRWRRPAGKKRSLSPPGPTISAMPRVRILPMTADSGWPCCMRRRRPAPGWT